MKNQETDIRLEKQLALALKSVPEDETPDCLAPEQMIALAERALPEGEAAPFIAHVALCTRCRREYVETVELLQLSEEVPLLKAQTERVVAAAAAPLPAGLVSPPSKFPNTPGLHQPQRPAFWKRWFALRRRVPTLCFALGMAAACGLVLVLWNSPHRVEKVMPDDRDRQLSALKKERDVQAARADHSEQEQQRLEKAIAALQHHQSASARLANEVAVLNGRVKTQGGQIARLNDDASALRQLPLPTAAWLSQENTRLRGNGELQTPASEVTLLRPMNAAVVTTRPILECRPLAGAMNYKISLESESTNREVAAPNSLSKTRWQPPVPLTPGTVYQWEVTALRGGEPIRSATAKFYVLNAAERHTITTARQKYAHSPLVLGAMYARLGLWKEAAQQFRAAVEANPSQEVARRWLREIETQHPQ